MQLFWKYLSAHKAGILAFCACGGIFALLFVLYRLPFAAVGYAVALSGAVCLVLFFFGFFRFVRRYQALELLKLELNVTLERMPQAYAPLELEYQELLQVLFEQRQQLAEDWQIRYSDMMDYYTAWAHQIKTPIAAMHLHLQAEDSPQNRSLLEDLQRVEQYVEMVLCYLRLDSDSTDYLFAEYELDNIVKQALRHFSAQFISRKIRLQYTTLSCRVLTDEKWLLFVVEQVLSNALKYTHSDGVITISLESPEILCIRDTGIGIEPEDLPRIFEKGYTGCNGRADKKASGIGLYLCRRICNNLHHTIAVESKPDVGTVVRISLHREEHRVE